MCGREFLHHGRYELHKKMHELEYKCSHDDCNFETDKKSSLEQHQQESGHSDFTVSEKVDKYVSFKFFCFVIVKILTFI